MPRDITVHFLGNARDLAASSATAEVSVDRFGNATARAGAQAEAASVGFDSLLGPLIAIGVALTVITAPISVLIATFGGLAAGVVGLAGFMGYLGDQLNGPHGLISDLQIMAEVLGTQAAPVAAQLLAQLTPLIPVVTELGSELISWFAERLPAMLPIMTQIVTILAGAVMGLFQAWGHLVDWFMAHWAGYVAAIQAVFGQIGTGISFALPLLGIVHAAFERLGPVIQFIRDHADSLKPVLYAVGALLVAMAASAVLTGAAIVLLVAGITAVASALSVVVNWLGRAGDLFWQLGHAAGAAASAIGSVANAINNLPTIGSAIGGIIPHFQSGGIVPGPIGAPMLAMVHGGETIIPAGSSTYNISVGASPLASPADIGRVIVQHIQEYERRGSKAWRGA